MRIIVSLRELILKKNNMLLDSSCMKLTLFLNDFATDLITLIVYKSQLNDTPDNHVKILEKVCLQKKCLHM